ncbi:MAG: hypothetical protein OEU26_21070 [Candidatus Tectomicrobia bacterium]|nr:hypothetical protein [Candidatus Tectomicrobia bacterium]
MTQQSDPEAVSEQEAEAIIERLQRDELSEQDKAVITKVIRSYLYLAQIVQQTGARLKTVRQFLLGKLSKKKTKTQTQQRTLTSRTTIRLTPQRIKRSI